MTSARGQRDVLSAAAWLHDIGRLLERTGEIRDHGDRAVREASGLLAEEGVPGETVDAVSECIAAQGIRASSPAPERVETKLLFDADTLVALGARGVVRLACIVGERSRRTGESFAVIDNTANTGLPMSNGPDVALLGEWARERLDVLHTVPGRRLGESRWAFMEEFFARFEGEPGGEGSSRPLGPGGPGRRWSGDRRAPDWIRWTVGFARNRGTRTLESRGMNHVHSVCHNKHKRAWVRSSERTRRVDWSFHVASIEQRPSSMSHDTETGRAVDGEGGESNEPTVRTEWSESRHPSVAVAEAVEEATDRDVTDLPQLNATIDPDALDKLVTQRPSAPLAISFTYAAARVSVHRDGWIEVRV